MRSFALILAFALLWSGSGSAAEPVLSLKRVLLSTGGVGYFEYEAAVTGNTDLTLAVPRDRIDDVLKSIVVYDDKGGIGSISLPGREPMRDLFRELPFNRAALDSPVALLNALKGAEIVLTQHEELAGRIVSITKEPVRLPDNGGTVTRHRLTVMATDGLRQVMLEEVESLRLADPKLQKQVDDALAGIARHGGQGRRQLTLHTTGEGARTVRVAYVIEAPLWKTAYRLTLGGTDAAKSGLQGWAVLENLSGEDWTDIDLTVVSGSPVTFRQALYESYYVNRPEIPVEVFGRVLPKVDQGAVTPPPTPPRAMAEASGGAAKHMATRGLSLSDAMPSAAPPPPAPGGAALPLAGVTAAETDETQAQVLFRHSGPVSVANGHSLLMPIINRAVPAERLALYQASTEPHHPLAAVRLSNDGTGALPPGILTLYERTEKGEVTYIGDARLSMLPAGERRLLSFAVDHSLTVDRSSSESRLLARARIVDGVLQLAVADREAVTYTIAGSARDTRRMLIEHPRRAGWEPASGGPVPEVTADAWRFTVEVPAGKTISFVVTLVHPRQERFELVELPVDQVGLYVHSDELPADLRKMLSGVAERKAALAERERVVEQVEQDQEAINKDQERLRQNLQAVGQGSDIGRRYMAKLGEQEDRLEGLNKKMTDAKAAEAAARQALVALVRGLKF
ncbi:MAG: hypothetical protein WCF85_02055 [Rhodospirillaceae bacterium]